MSAARCRVLIVALSIISGCVPVPDRKPEKSPVRWIVVEKQVGEVLPGGRVGDGQVDPRARVLTMQPLYREDLQWEVVVDPHDYFVEVLEISPGVSANPGEIITAKVRVGRARAGEVYRLTAIASRSDVRIVGTAEQVVLANTPAFFRFTSATIGVGGISVGVDRIATGPPGMR